MIDIVDVNARVAIAFAFTMIVVLLTYIAFFKDPIEKKSRRGQIILLLSQTPL